MIYKRQKIFIIISIVLLLLTVFSLTIFANAYNAMNKESNAASALYIYNRSDLEDFRDNVNNGNSYSGTTIYLENDITLSSSNWDTIGVGYAPFSGTFDGQGHKISNLRFVYHGDTETDQWTIGLFGYISGATIRNLWLDNYDIWLGQEGTYNSGTHQWSNWKDNNSYSTSDYVGGLVGECAGSCTISNVLATNGNVTAVDLGAYGGQNAGGLVGWATGSLRLNNVEVRCNVKAVADEWGDQVTAGGMVGRGSVSATNCFFRGSIATGAEDNDTVAKASVIGGILALVDGSRSFTRCAASISSYNIGSDLGDLGFIVEGMATNTYEGYQQNNAICGGSVVYEAVGGPGPGGQHPLRFTMSEPTWSYTNCIQSSISSVSYSTFNNIGWNIYQNSSSNIPYTSSSAWYINSSINSGNPIQMVFMLFEEFKLLYTDGGTASVSPSSNNDNEFYYSHRLSFSSTSKSYTYVGQTFTAEEDNEYCEFEYWSVSENEKTVTAVFSRLTTDVFIDNITLEGDTESNLHITSQTGRTWSEIASGYTYVGLEYGTYFRYNSGAKTITVSYVDGKMATISSSLSGSNSQAYEIVEWEYYYGNENPKTLPTNLELNDEDLHIYPVFEIRKFEAHFYITSNINTINDLGGALLTESGYEYDLSQSYTYVYGSSLYSYGNTLTLDQPSGFS